MPSQGKHQDFTFDGLRGHKARHHLRQTPKAIAGWVVEVYPDEKSKTYIAGDRWFMKIIDGSVSGSPKTIKACRWLYANSVVRVASTHPDPVSVEIKTIKAYGPQSAPMYETFFQ